MQNAKDSFYEELRGRLAGLNPERTVVVRGVTRPGVLVDENETGNVVSLPDCFHLRWTESSVEQTGALPVAALSCEISYGTAGTPMNGGLDRGRALAAMDGELLSAVGQTPQNAAKYDYSALASGGATSTMSTRVWWSDLSFAAAKVDRDRMARVATVKVFSYQEEGEL